MSFIRHALLALAALVLVTLPTTDPAEARSGWTIRKEVERGKSIDLQTMYFINTRTCKAHKVPPQPAFRNAPKLGQVKFRSGTTQPRQCPSETINANFTIYTAGATPGRDRFTIRYKATESSKTFNVRFIVDVK